MAKLTAYFQLQEEISAGLNRIADKGKEAGDVMLLAGNRLQEALDATTGSLDKLNAVTGSAVSVAQSYRDSLSQQEDELERLQEAYVGLALTENQNSDTAKALKKDIDTLSDEIDKNKKALEKAEKAAGIFGDTGKEAIGAMTTALTSAGLAKAIQGIYDVFAIAVGKAIEFER